jgi:hypothetical protein
VGPTTPIPRGDRFGLGPVRSPLLRASRLLSLPLGTEMFQFPRFASRLRGMTALARRRVSPFGHPGIDACVPLPLAYRSLPRPSSPPCAQAFPTCLRSLDYTTVGSSRRRCRTFARNAGQSVACSKQITRDLFQIIFTSDNHFKQNEIESLSSDSQIRDLPNPSVVKQRGRSRPREAGRRS